MKQLTLRGLDPALDRRLKQKARERGESVNRTALHILRSAVGLEKAVPADAKIHRDLDHLIGTWSRDEAKEFDQRLKEQRTIDSELWK